jgi:hypothetical protein
MPPDEVEQLADCHTESVLQPVFVPAVYLVGWRSMTNSGGSRSQLTSRLIHRVVDSG